MVEWNKMVPSLPLLSCELPVSVNENPDRKKMMITIRLWRPLSEQWPRVIPESAKKMKVGSIVQHNTNMPKNLENQKINHITSTFLKKFLSQEYLFEIRPKKFMVRKCKFYTKLTQDAYFENGKLMIGYIINSVALSVKN